MISGFLFVSGVVLANASLDIAFHDSQNKKILKLKDNEGKKDYIEQFWVGLLDGDGSIVVRKNKNSVVYPCFEIGLKYLNENVNMLKLISEHVGGTINYEKKNKSIIKVKWMALSAKDANNCLKILSKYPLLTSRKICQLEHLLKCTKEKSWDYHVKNRDKKYDYQKELVNNKNKDFIIPIYFQG